MVAGVVEAVVLAGQVVPLGGAGIADGEGEGAVVGEAWMSAHTPAPARRGLDREQVIEAALRITGTAGLGGLTMRALAEELGVTPPAVHHHGPSKGALVEAGVAAVLAPLLPLRVARYEAVDTPSGWVEVTRESTRMARNQYLRYPGLAGFLLVNGPTAGEIAVRAEVTALVRLNVPLDRAAEIYDAGARWVLGFVHAEALARAGGSSAMRGHRLSRAQRRDQRGRWGHRRGRSGRSIRDRAGLARRRGAPGDPALARPGRVTTSTVGGRSSGRR